MFSNPKSLTSAGTKVETVIGPSTSITGNINSTGTVRINGTYTGNIVTISDVIIEKGAYIKGNIKATSVSINGTVEGNIKCSGFLELLPPGILTGDIEVNNFTIENGSTFNGRCNMYTDEFKKISAPTK